MLGRDNKLAMSRASVSQLGPIFHRARGERVETEALGKATTRFAATDRSHYDYAV